MSSPEYRQLLAGEIEPDEYVRIVKQQIAEGLTPRSENLHQAGLHVAAARSSVADALRRSWLMRWLLR